MTVDAPFRFARISRRVHEPAWGPLVTHDIPFADGVSGTATLTLTAITPLLIGGERRQATLNAPGSVRPFKAGGKYAIPPSTLQGLCRSILEIAAFGRLGPFVEDRKFGIRDLSPTKTAELHYVGQLTSSKKISGQTHVTPKTKAGFLVKNSDGKITIIPCKMARIHVKDVKKLQDAKFTIAKKTPQKYNALLDGTTADARYNFFLNGLKGGKSNLKAFFDVQKKEWHDHQTHKRVGKHPNTQIVTNKNPIKIFYRQCVHSTSGVGKKGMLVLTGKPGFNKTKSNPLDPGMKKWEFVFYKQKPKKSLNVSDSEWNTFLQIHDPNHEKPPRPGVVDKDINPTWKYWKGDFNGAKKIPIFYLSKDGIDVDTFGMAYMFKAAHTQSTHDLLKNSCKKHIEDSENSALDLAHLIFGTATEIESRKGLKRRAWFGQGISDDGPENKPAIDLGPAILLSPKPSYVGIYVRQSSNGDKIPLDEPFASYTIPEGYGGKKHLKKPELAGVKIWPASQPNKADVRLPPLGDLANNNSVQTRLFPVAKGTKFTIPLTFHNLRPVELGALLWALSYGDPGAFEKCLPRLHHRLGIGKPFGLGEVAINVDLNADGDARAETEFVTFFKDHMQEAYQAWGDGGTWSGSKQIEALKKAANPIQNPTGDLKYMKLNARENNGVAAGTYVGGKGTKDIMGSFLPDYVDGRELGDAVPPLPEPIVGARIRFKSTDDPRYRNKEGVITGIEGEGEFAKYLITLDSGRTLKVFVRRFDV